MKHNDKKGLFIVGVAGLFMGLLSYGCATSNETKPILSNTNNIRYANDETTDLVTSGEETQVVISKDGKIYIEYKDENGNGIPDELEATDSEEALDKLFTVSLSTLLGGVFGLINFFYSKSKIKAMKNNVEAIASGATDNVNTYSDTASKIASSVEKQATALTEVTELVNQCTAKEEEQTKKIDELVEQNKALQESNEALRTSNEELTKGYSSVSSRLDTILANQQIMSQSDENVANGIAKKVANNSKEAINYGKTTVTQGN